MRIIVIMTAFAVAGCINPPGAHDEPASSSGVPVGTAKPAAIHTAAPASHGLADLDAMTFDCPKGGLNAAAREAAKAPSQGTYQFSYFRIVNDAHHASYEVRYTTRQSPCRNRIAETPFCRVRTACTWPAASRTTDNRARVRVS